MAQLCVRYCIAFELEAVVQGPWPFIRLVGVIGPFILQAVFQRARDGNEHALRHTGGRGREGKGREGCALALLPMAATPASLISPPRTSALPSTVPVTRISGGCNTYCVYRRRPKAAPKPPRRSTVWLSSCGRDGRSIGTLVTPREVRPPQNALLPCTLEHERVREGVTISERSVLVHSFGKPCKRKSF